MGDCGSPSWNHIVVAVVAVSDRNLGSQKVKGKVISGMARATEGTSVAGVLRLDTLEQTLEGSPTLSFSETTGAIQSARCRRFLCVLAALPK